MISVLQLAELKVKLINQTSNFKRFVKTKIFENIRRLILQNIPLLYLISPLLHLFSLMKSYISAKNFKVTFKRWLQYIFYPY